MPPLTVFGVIMLGLSSLCSGRIIGQNYVLSHPNLGLPNGSPDFFKPLTVCTNKPFGITGMKVPICETVSHYSRSKPPIRTCKIGKVDAQTAERLKEAYGGMLKEAYGGMLQSQHMKSSSRDNLPLHDGDMCCPTYRRINKAPNLMEDSFGNSRDIVHLEEFGLFQFYHVGTCLASSDQNYCSGTCVQETSTVYLMVIRTDTEMGTSFEPFDVSSYCSCRNLGSSDPRGSVSSQQRSAINTTAAPTNNSKSTSLVNSVLPSVTKTNDIRVPTLFIPGVIFRSPKYSRRIPGSRLRPTTRPPVSRVIPTTAITVPSVRVASNPRNETPTISPTINETQTISQTRNQTERVLATRNERQKTLSTTTENVATPATNSSDTMA